MLTNTELVKLLKMNKSSLFKNEIGVGAEKYLRHITGKDTSKHR